MARVPYVDLSGVPSGTELGKLCADYPRIRNSTELHLRALANQPPALKAFVDMSHYVRDETALSPRQRELVILATAHALDVPYEIDYHTRAARRVGVPEEQVAAFPNWAASRAFDAAERAMLTYADRVSRRLEVDDEQFEELRAHFSPGQIVDLSLVVGWYHLCAAFLVPLRILPEPENP